MADSGMIDLRLTAKITGAIKKSIGEMEKLQQQRIASDSIAGFVDGVTTCLAIIRRNMKDGLEDK